MMTKVATYKVTKTTVTNDGACDADCSLREAVASARTAVGGNTVEFDSSLDGQTIDFIYISTI
jgi:CSLREA domain-containing protein